MVYNSLDYRRMLLYPIACYVSPNSKDEAANQLERERVRASSAASGGVQWT